MEVEGEYYALKGNALCWKSDTVDFILCVLFRGVVHWIEMVLHSSIKLQCHTF